MTSTSDDGTFPMNTLLHMIPIKLGSTNYLLWKNQMLPLFSYQKLTNHIDGTPAPPATTLAEDKPIPNPAFKTWNNLDQRAVILLNSSLTEEAAAEVLGLSTARAIWIALQSAYSNSSVERIHSLRDSLRNLSKGTSTVSDYGRNFKAICDKLSAIGHPVAEMDKLHWFLCGLGTSFETFSTAIRTSKPSPVFRDLLSQAESHEIFLQSLHGSIPPPAAFFSQQQTHSSSTRGGSRGGNQNGGRGRGGRRPPHCQLCRTNGHYASACPSLHTYASNASTSDANLAQAFTSQCHDGPPIVPHKVYPEKAPIRPTTPSQPNGQCGLCPDLAPDVSPFESSSSNAPPHDSPPHSDDDNPNSDDDNPNPSHEPISDNNAPPEPSSAHPMTTRSKSGVIKKKHFPNFASLASHGLHIALLSTLCGTAAE
ncbi:zinc finger, CCHC-type, Gag-polypeptide of LTR copia-type [Artemisia annua]|uniref:Zinc finger, CCHC-type, Gag-polypeptide of LTR copia-type n=1 Tax=Artemisia annua TaxID=35608 RepID=A0A2U1KVB2_ARTAN|nr:zinc finger, CCHC-type, Gag-polypeptide of LTR copia-type [Artemisia annua]